MSTSTPLVFRPSAAQRAITALLCAGSWVVGIRGLYLLITSLPRLLTNLRLAGANNEPTALIWVGIVAAVLLCLAAGILVLLSLLGLILIEGTHVLVDESGITVEHAGLPRALAARLGAGHLPWKQVVKLEKGRAFFILRGGLPEGAPDDLLARHYARTTLRFLLVDELERLILLILERSPNLTFS
jgi:hypothetical protein